MLKKVLFRDRQEAQADDFNNIQTYTQSTLDNIVADAITDAARYKGLSVAQASTTEITIGAGRLYDQGRVYNRASSTQKDLIADLPVSQQRIVTVVAYGQTVETTVEPRDFLINLEDETTEPQSVAMVEARNCEIGYLSGSEGASPAAPAVQAGQVKVADVLLNSSGIISITMSAGTRLGGLEGANTDILALNNWRHTVTPRVSALQATLADLRGEVASRAPMSRIIDMDRNLTAIWRAINLLDARLTGAMQNIAQHGAEIDELATQTANSLAAINANIIAIDNLSDEFAEAEQSEDDASLPGETHEYHVEQGLHFPASDSVTASLDLFNAIDSTVKKSAAGWVMPAYSHDAAMATADPTGEINLSSFSVTTTETETYITERTVHQTATRRVRKRKFEHRERGWTFLQDENGYSENGVPFGTQENIRALALGGWDYKGDVYENEQYTVTRRVPVERNRQVESTSTLNGLTLAQTMLCPRAMWVTQVGLNFSDLDASGDVTVLLTRANAQGRPNRQDVISQTTVAHADLTATGETQVPIEPAFVEAGERIALVLVTNGSHKHKTVTGVEDTQGVVFYGSDTGWQHTDDGKSLFFTLYSAKFTRTNTEVRLGDVNLAGGVSDLTISTEEFEPGGTKVEFEYQYNGVWYPLAEADQLVTNTPSTVPLRAVCTGTTAMQPAFKTGAGRIEAAAIGTSLTHFSTLHALSAGSDEVYVDLELHWFDSSEQTVSVVLLDADDGDAEIAADNTTDLATVKIHDRDGNDTGMEEVLKRFAFAPTGLQNFRIKITGTTGGAAKRPFSIAERNTSWVI